MRKKETITLSIPPGTKEQLEAIASELNLLWGNRPSISGLIVAIAQRKLEVGTKFSLTKVQVEALEQALKLLVDCGYLLQAQTVASLLIDKGNLELPLRQKLLTQVSQPSQAWRVLLEAQLATKTPFRLFYQDANKQYWEFTVRHGLITFREKRYYLEIWAEETQGNSDLPELSHNWSLRLDRISNLTVLPTDGFWRDDLDSTKVYLHFCGRLVNAYESRPEDLEDEKKEGIRQVIRRVSNTYWLFREIRAYGDQCEIVAPESARVKFKEELRSQCKLYGLEIN
jgi:predicted DNA-binding transcriptional regulator YafY